MIAVLDERIGNIQSIFNSIYVMGFDVEVVPHAKILDTHTHLVIPGVGSYKNALSEKHIGSAKNDIHSFINSGRPVLGICIGMQILSYWGEEGGGSKGLGVIPGEVNKISNDDNVLLPHVGWNAVNFSKEHPVFKGIKNGTDYYFVHSYCFNCDNRYVFGLSHYTKEFPSVVCKDNVIGFQFHPEKSQSNGLKLISNFCEWDGVC